MCPFTVRVTARWSLADFLGSLVTSAVGAPRRDCRTIGLRISARTSLRTSAPLPFNPLFRQGAAVSLLRLRIARVVSNGISTVSSIGIANRLILRTRLTPGRLTSPGKPWSFGGGESHPPCRYLYLHLLFHALQYASRHAFSAAWNAPLPII